MLNAVWLIQVYIGLLASGKRMNMQLNSFSCVSCTYFVFADELFLKTYLLASVSRRMH